MTHKSVDLVTENQLVEELMGIGLSKGQTVMVHSSLSELGYVIGAAQTVVEAILQVIGDEGTLIMPAFSPEVSDPIGWQNQSFSEKEIQLIKENLPVFNKETTPTSMGALAETFRNWPNVYRSDHPQVSVCALGPNAAYITGSHPLEWGEGAGSPFQRIYEIDAKLLLLGVWTNRATMLHYAESLVPHGRRKSRAFPMIVKGKRVWVSVPDVGDDLNTHFPPIGDNYFAQDGAAQIRQIGSAKSCFTSTRGLVDFAKEYLWNVLADTNSRPFKPEG